MKRLNRQQLAEQSRDFRRTASDGQVLIMFAAGLLFLLGMVAVAVDTGFIMAERRQVQSAADAGAMAAAKAKLDYKFQPAAGDLETVQVDAGKAYGSSNAATIPDNVIVDTSPDGYGDDFVEVTVSKDVDMFFLRALYDGEWGTSATAVAGIEDVQLPYALMALRNCSDPGAVGINVNGGISIDVNEGSIMSNCNITRSGDSSFVLADGAIDAAGTIDPGSNWYAGHGYRPGKSVVDDPIVTQGYLPPDKAAAKSVRDVTDVAGLGSAVSNLTNLGGNSGRCPNNTTCVMQPGFYGGNLTLDVRGTLQLEPGIYYFGDNFFLTQQTNSAIVQGDDVMIYVGDNASWRPHNGQINIEAPAVSPYTGGVDGMALWIGNGSDFNMQANNSGAFAGVVYAPDSTVTLQGGPGAQGMQVIVGSLELSGNGAFDILYEQYVEFDVPGIFLVQ